MALARLALKNLTKRVAVSSPALARNGDAIERAAGVGAIQSQNHWSDLHSNNHELLRRFMSTSGATETTDSKEVAVNEGGSKKPKLFSRKKGKRGIWKSTERPEFVPSLQEIFPSGLGDALMQATENINRLFSNLQISPSRLIGRIKEKDDHYKLKYQVPGLSKEDLKITIDDGVMTIRGEHEEEEEEGSDDEHWQAKSYGYIYTEVLLPDDAKVDEIKAELKNGVLNIIIPRTEMPKKDVTEVKIH